MRITLDKKQYKEKPAGVDCGRIKQEAQVVDVSLEELTQRIGNGQTVIPAVMNGRKATDWVEQQLFMVDVDNADSSQAILRNKQAVDIYKNDGIEVAFGYSTFSSTKEKPKYRLGFIMDKPITSEIERLMIVTTLIDLIPQSDKACKNADRIFFGTNTPVTILNEDARVSLESIFAIAEKKMVSMVNQENDSTELKDVIHNFPLLKYLENHNGNYKTSGNYSSFYNCNICGHHEDLVHFADTNMWRCFHKNISGNAVHYFMHTENLSKREAIDKLYELSGIEKKPKLIQWSEPTPLGAEIEKPVFPINAFPDTFRKYIEAVAEHTQTFPEFAGSVALATVAIALQGRVSIGYKQGYSEPSNIYLLMVAESGERKSGVLKEMTEVLYQYEAKINEPAEDEESLEETKEKKTVKSLMASDITLEALATKICENDGKLAIVDTESDIFSIMAGLYSSGTPNIGTVLKAWGGEPIKVDRKGQKPEVVAHAYLTVLISAQPVILEQIFANPQFKSRGLCARFLYCYVPLFGKRGYETEEINHSVKIAYDQTVF